MAWTTWGSNVKFKKNDDYYKPENNPEDNPDAEPPKKEEANSGNSGGGWGNIFSSILSMGKSKQDENNSKKLGGVKLT